MPMVERDREIRKRRNKRNKVKALKVRLQAERDSKARTRLLTRLKKISPNSPEVQK